MKVLFVILIGLWIIGCSPQQDSPDKSTEKPVIYTTFYPTAYFSERIAQQNAEVVCPVPEEEDAIFWEAYKHPHIIQQYQQADLIVLNGAEFAKWVAKVPLPQQKVVDTSQSFAKEFITIHDAATHSHGGKTHSHAGLDGHTWVDPVNAKIQAEAIKDALCRIQPKKSQIFAENLHALHKDLDLLIATLKNYQQSKKSTQPLFASHPAYNYVARRFKWNIKNLDLDPQTMPNDKTFAKIKAMQEKHPAKYIIWESYPTEAIAKRFQEELSLESIEFSPCELLSKEEQKQGMDYISVMKQNLQNLQKIWQ